MGQNGGTTGSQTYWRDEAGSPEGQVSMSAYRAKQLEEVYKVLEDMNVILQRQPVL
jgi:hypothetical protein